MVDVKAAGHKSVTANETQAAAISCLKRSWSDVGNVHIFAYRRKILLKKGKEIR